MTNLREMPGTVGTQALALERDTFDGPALLVGRRARIAVRA